MEITKLLQIFERKATPSLASKIREIIDSGEIPSEKIQEHANLVCSDINLCNYAERAEAFAQSLSSYKQNKDY